MIYDDGTELWVDPSSGTSYAFDANGNVVSSVAPSGAVNYVADVRESNKLNAYVAAPNGDTRPWYERVAEFGLSRAIDAHYGPYAVQKGSLPATYAGQNGYTYTNGQLFGNGSGLPLLLIIGVIAFVAMQD